MKSRLHFFVLVMSEIGVYKNDLSADNRAYTDAEPRTQYGNSG